LGKKIEEPVAVAEIADEVPEIAEDAVIEELTDEE